jgi:hypothetical protein
MSRLLIVKASSWRKAFIERAGNHGAGGRDQAVALNEAGSQEIRFSSR